jgi:hypothetical protein
MHRIMAALLLFTGSAFAEPALTISCEDPLFAKDTTHERLVAAFGAQNVRAVSEKGPEGMPPNVRSVVYPNDPKRRLEVSWNDGKARAKPFAFVFDKPSQWVAPKGVRVGTSLAELEQLDGGAFTIAGFGGLTDGMASWTGALSKLPGGCFLAGSMAPTVKLPKAAMNKISGDEDFPSTHLVMRQAKPVLHQVQVVYPTQ